MEQEKKVTELDEKSINKRNYSKEFNYLNQVKQLINFKLFREEILCENNLCETIAWYIDCLQKKDETTREQKIQNLIDTLKNFQGNETEKIKYINTFFNEKKIIWLEENGLGIKAKLLKFSPEQQKILEGMYIPKDDGKITIILTGIVKQGIPERYRIRFRERGLEAKVMAENRQNFVNAMRKQNEESEKLKKDL